MRINKNIIISVVVTLIAGVGISALVFKPMGTVATEKNNAELYLEMKEQAKEEVQAELDIKLQEEISKIKKETNLEIDKLKVEYDKAIAEAKLEQANNLETVIQETQNKINESTSWASWEEKRQEEIKKNPVIMEGPGEPLQPTESLDNGASGVN